MGMLIRELIWTAFLMNISLNDTEALKSALSVCSLWVLPSALCHKGKPVIASCWHGIASIKFVSLMSLVMLFRLPTNRRWGWFSRLWITGCVNRPADGLENSHVLSFSLFRSVSVASYRICLVHVMISLRAAVEDVNSFCSNPPPPAELSQRSKKCQEFS